MARKKIYVLDTNVLLTDPFSVKSFNNHDIVIPFKVLEELDKKKKEQNFVGSNARRVVRFLDSLSERGNLSLGVRIDKGKGLLSIGFVENNKIQAPLSEATPDDHIIATSLKLKEENPERKVILVSRDINVRVKSRSLNLLSEDFVQSQVIKDISDVFTGFTEVLTDDQIIDRFYSGEDVYLEDKRTLYPNQFVMLISSSNEKKTALSRFVDYKRPLIKVQDYSGGVWGLYPRNKEQNFAMNLLLDDDVPMITLLGRAGSGKTLCAVAAGLEKVLESNKEKPYRRLVITRPIQPLGKDLGYLPGSLEEKMSPWLKPIQDNLVFLLGNDRGMLEMQVRSGTIDIEAMTYIRGRSIANAFIIVDEAQNMTQHELKTVITRVGENSKLVLTGDIEQIDNPYLDETSNGLTCAVEKFKNHDIAGHILFDRGERSKLATLASKIL